MRIAASLFITLTISAALCLLLTWPFMWIWNYSVVAALTIANPIDYWVAFYLMLFVSMFLVGSRSGTKP
jgi:hypothetical protein